MCKQMQNIVQQQKKTCTPKRYNSIKEEEERGRCEKSDRNIDQHNIKHTLRTNK